MADTLARWNALVNNFTHDATAYWRNRERRLIALSLVKGASIEDITKVVDASGPVSFQAVYLAHPASELSKVKEEIAKIIS